MTTVVASAINNLFICSFISTYSSSLAKHNLYTSKKMFIISSIRSLLLLLLQPFLFPYVTKKVVVSGLGPSGRRGIGTRGHEIVPVLVVISIVVGSAVAIIGRRRGC